MLVRKELTQRVKLKELKRKELIDDMFSGFNTAHTESSWLTLTQLECASDRKDSQMLPTQYP